MAALEKTKEYIESEVMEQKSMSISLLDSIEFYTAKYIEDEKELHVGSKSIVLNLDNRNGSDITFQSGCCHPFNSVVLKDVTIKNIKKALVIEDFEENDIMSPTFCDQIKSKWKSLWKYSHLERNRNIPLYKSPQLRVGGNITMNFCYADKGVASAIHRTHPIAIDEIHLQVAGVGKVQKLYTESPDSVYQEYVLSPGAVNEKLCDEKGVYPWHRYVSITNVMFVCVELEI